MPILNGAGRTAIDPGDLSTFQAPPKHTVLQGPMNLYRFGKSRGKWWFDSSLLQALKEDFYEASYGDTPRQKNDDGTRFARYSLAVSQEWNKLALLSTLTLKAGDSLDCFVGPAASQPEWEKKKSGPMLGGGMLQYAVYEIGKVPAQNLSETTMRSMWQKWSR